MKIHVRNYPTKMVLSSVLALAVTAPLAFSAVGAEKGSARGGASDLMNLKQIKTREEAEALKPGDTFAMACAKCKSMVVERVTTERGHIRLVTPGEKHQCPGCNSTIKVVGHGKQAKDVVEHVCEKCGSDSVYCCATKAGEGATKGMEKR